MRSIQSEASSIESSQQTQIFLLFLVSTVFYLDKNSNLVKLVLLLLYPAIHNNLIVLLTSSSVDSKRLLHFIWHAVSSFSSLSSSHLTLCFALVTWNIMSKKQRPSTGNVLLIKSAYKAWHCCKICDYIYIEITFCPTIFLAFLAFSRSNLACPSSLRTLVMT